MEKRNLYRGTIAVLSACLLLTAAGCSGKEDSNIEDTPDTTPVGGQVNNQIDFDLESSNTPNFDDIILDDTPAVSGDLYTIEDGVAYALDPVTMEKVGPPLDPITHLPIEQETDDASDTPNEGLDKEEEKLENTQKPSQTEQHKLPNTGIYLEND